MSGAPGLPAGSVVLGGSWPGRLRAPFDDPSVDVRVRSARLGSLLYGVAAVVGSVSIPFMPSHVNHTWLWLLTLVSVGAALTQLVLPWSRWPHRAILVSTTFSLVVFGVGVGLAHALLYYLPLYALTFAFVGLTQRPGTALALGPLALGFGSTGLLKDSHEALLVPLLIMIGVSVLLGELIANYVRLQRVAADTLDELLMSVAGLTACASMGEAADLGAAVMARLAAADFAIVVVPEGADSSRFLYAGGAGVPEEASDAARGTVVLDTASTPSGTALAVLQHRMIFIPDARTSPLVMRSWVDDNDVASALYLPLTGQPGAVSGVAIAGYTKYHKSVDAITTRGLSLLAETTGRVLEQLRQAERLARDADTDSLTGLANRRVFFRELDDLAHGDAVVFLDLDHFKNLNDTLGHVAGDRELAAFGAALQEQVRDSDTAARYGGEEFAVIVRGDGRTGAILMAERLREAWARYSAITFSVGAALHQDGSPPGLTLAAADRAVYAAKDAGRDRMCWADGPEAYGPAVQVPLFGATSAKHRRDDGLESA